MPLTSRYLESAELAELGLSVGKNVLIDERAVIVRPGDCHIGSNVRIDSGVIVTPGPLVIGDYVHIGANAHLNCSAGIKIGDGCNFGQGSKIYSSSDNYVSGEIGGPWFPCDYDSSTFGALEIMGLNIVGANAIVGPGVVMSSGSCVGANSFLKESTGGWEVWAGNPARRVGLRFNRGNDYYLQRLSS